MDCDKYWGDGAERNLAPDLEEYYENTTGKSCVYWVSDDDEMTSESIVHRPEEYVECGYTANFKDWGRKMVSEALENGCETVEDVFDYITDGMFTFSNGDEK